MSNTAVVQHVFEVNIIERSLVYHTLLFNAFRQFVKESGNCDKVADELLVREILRIAECTDEYVVDAATPFFWFNLKRLLRTLSNVDTTSQDAQKASFYFLIAARDIADVHVS